MAWPWHGWGTYCSGFFYANQPQVDANSSASRFSRAPGLECIKSKKAMTLNYNSFYCTILSCLGELMLSAFQKVYSTILHLTASSSASVNSSPCMSMQHLLAKASTVPRVAHDRPKHLEPHRPLQCLRAAACRHLIHEGQQRERPSEVNRGLQVAVLTIRCFSSGVTSNQ